jgi:large subunit ribosomal protein L3
MMNLVLHTNLFIKSLLNASVNSIRDKSTYLNRPRLRNPSWFNKKERAKHDESISPENNQFVHEVVTDRFQSTNSLMKTPEIIKTGEWNVGQRRTGLIARKIGQYPLWKKDGTKIRTTLLQVIDNHVIKYIPPGQYEPAMKSKVKNPERYGCLMVGAESCDPTLLTKEYCNLFSDYGGMPKRILSRFLVHPNSALPSGTPLNVTHFRVGDFVDVRGKTVDRNMQGVMKKHGFKGMPASHGNAIRIFNFHE